MDVVVWLRSLGLGKYEAIFRENDIDETVLPRLTHENLKELGVTSFGHRVKLLDAIAALRSDASGKASSVDTATMSSAPSAHPEDRAERRQVTVMFSDLVGSTALSARMDPEDLREVISAYQKCVAETVQRFDGFVAKYMGDGVLVYFGYPQAHEDDPERAVRAGLGLIAAVSALRASVPLQTRVGIATGLVVVGDLIGSGEAQERGIVGETPNLAARLQGIAEPNRVVIAESTRKLLGNLFELDDLRARELKGIAGSVRVWTALRASSVESRFEAQHETKLTPLVGRDEELELLVRRWRQAVGGEGRVVLLSGEPGIGKSRLTVALEEQLQTAQYTPLRFFCSPLHTDSALYPFISQLERAAGFERNDKMEAKLDKLSSLLGASPNHANDVQLLAELLSVPTGDRYPSLNLSARQKKQKPQATFLFKHALVRDVAYGSLLRGQRQQLHGRIANVLAEHFPTTVEAEPEVLAHHYREAGMADAASTYFERAGDRAAARSAYIEATAHFRAAIEEADRLPQKDERARRALTLLLKLGPAIAVTIGEWKPEVEAVYRRAHDLGREVGDGPKLFWATWGLWLCANRRDNKQSRKWTEELTSLAQRLGDESLLLEAQHCRWGDELYGAGNVLRLLETTEEGIRRYDAKRHAKLADAFGGDDPGVCALGCYSLGLALRGFPDQARRTLEKTFALAEFLSHPPSIGLAHRIAGWTFVLVHDRHGGERMGERLVALAEKFDLPIFGWHGRYVGGWAKAQGLTLSEGLALMEEAFPLASYETAYKRDCCALAEARFDAGRVTEALALVDHALNTGEGPASGLFVPEIHRLRGVFLRSLGSPAEEVERTLCTALEIAEEQGAFLLKLRAATSLARLWLDQGKRREARDLLAPVYGWFTEGFDTLDLKEAKALLDELAA